MLQSVIEQTRIRLSRTTDAGRKSSLGQFLTPATTAQFMAGLFAFAPDTDCHLLDAGAGIGSLSHAFLARPEIVQHRAISVTAFEIDDVIRPELKATLAALATTLPLHYEIIAGDFIEQAVNLLQFGPPPGFTHAILNPPYKKINSRSTQRLLLRQAGIETGNLYSAFVALALALLAPGGQLVAIIPRSFCNGPYYRPFRDFILEHAAITHLHLFDSRTHAFRDDAVLQENVIIKLERGRQQGEVCVSTSQDDRFIDTHLQRYSFSQVVAKEDSEHIIHIPTSHQTALLDESSAIRHSLGDLGLTVSTGPVVDFRLKDHLRPIPGPDTVPLLYPIHFSSGNMIWPIVGSKKPNAICRNPETEKWLYPGGYYCVVRRFSSKEEVRRIVASVVTPDAAAGAAMLGLENHLNVFHQNKQGLPEALARGLAVYLNTRAVDERFRQSSGHTQVNALDLKIMKYPSRTALTELGEWAMRCGKVTPEMGDQQLARLLT